jgi:hypothetical protein
MPVGHGSSTRKGIRQRQPRLRRLARQYPKAQPFGAPTDGKEASTNAGAFLPAAAAAVRKRSNGQAHRSPAKAAWVFAPSGNELAPTKAPSDKGTDIKDAASTPRLTTLVAAHAKESAIDKRAPRLTPAEAVLEAVADGRGPEVLLLDDGDKIFGEGTPTLLSNLRTAGREAMPRMAAKLFVEAPSNKAEEFPVKWGPPWAPLTMDDDAAPAKEATAHAVSNLHSMAAALACVMAFANDARVSGQVVASLLANRLERDPGEVGGAVSVPARDDPNNQTHRLPNNWTHQSPNDRTHRLPATAVGGVDPRGENLAPSGAFMARGMDEEDNYVEVPVQLPHGMAILRATMVGEETTMF